jgi:hypothetical protein
VQRKLQRLLEVCTTMKAVCKTYGPPKATSEGCCWSCQKWSKDRVLVEHESPESCSGVSYFVEPWCRGCFTKTGG